MRNCDEFQVTKSDVEKILDWENNQAVQDGVEVAFKPARVILQVKSSQNFKFIYLNDFSFMQQSRYIYIYIFISYKW